MVDRTAFLVANGQCDLSPQQISTLRSTTNLIAIDGGLKYCLTVGLTPSVFIGDLDSSNEDDLKKFPLISRHCFPKDKDKTDLELAIEYVTQRSSEKIRVFAALGKRIDHTLQNLQLLTRYPARITLESSIEEIFALSKKSALAVFPGQTLSLFPLNGPVQGLTTSGLKWELKNGTLDKQFVSISNVCLDNEVTIEFAQGDLLCILIKEANP